MLSKKRSITMLIFSGIFLVLATIFLILTTSMKGDNAKAIMLFGLLFALFTIIFFAAGASQLANYKRATKAIAQNNTLASRT